MAEENKTNVCNAEPSNTECQESLSDDSEGSSRSSTSSLDHHTEQLASLLRINKYNGMSYFISRAAKMLRLHTNIEIEGSGINTQIAVSLVLALQKRKLATIDCINTGMDIGGILSRSRAEPVPIMRFQLKRGEFAEYVSGQRQQKIVAIFEKYDQQCTAHLFVETVKSLDLGLKFVASSSQKRKALAYLDGFAKHNRLLDLPDFIEYASVLVHPLLKEEIFESAIATIMA